MARAGAVVALVAAATGAASPGQARAEPAAAVPADPAEAAAVASSRPLAQRPATGQFEVVDGTVFDPAGVQFVPAGTNMNGPNSFFGEPTAGRSSTIGDDWRFNLVRLVTCEPEGCNGNDWVNTTSNDLDAIVAEYTARRIVVLIA